MLPSPCENIRLSHRRIHSPSLPDLWMPAGKYIGAPQPQSTGISTIHFPPAARPSLGSLDLASPPTKSALPLTPPLTPASSRATDSETRSSRSNSIDISSEPYAQELAPTSPWSAAEHFIPSRNTSESEHFSPPSHKTLNYSVLPSPTSPTRPRASPGNRARELEPESETQPATRFLFISGIPKTASSQSLKQAFVACGDLKGIFVRFQPEHGAIVLAFFDVRHTIRAHRQINTRLFFDNIRLASRFISADELRKLIGQSNFVNSNDGDLYISTSFVGPDGELDAAALQNVLASFGDLRSFGIMDTHARAFHVEYFDARDASSALNALNGRVILGVRLHLTLRDSEARSEEQVPFPRGAFPTSAPESPSSSPIIQAPPGIPFPHKTSPPSFERRLSVDSSLHALKHTALAHSISEQDLRAKARAQQQHQAEPEHPPPQHVHSRRISNIYHFDSVGKMALPRTPPRPRSISVSSETASPVAGRLALPPYLGPLPAPLASPNAEETSPWPGERELAPYAADEGVQVQVHAHGYAPEQYFMGPVQQPQPQPHAAPPVLQLQMPQRTRQLPMQAGPRSGGGLGLELTADAPPERNRIDIARIERGDDTRTTVMIKNIPNKMSDRHLIDFINDVCPRKIDFLYLRMDFTNGCNVGYAFVNFIRVEDLLHFAKTKLGTKWNLFSSEKILGMSYANYQGKEALIDKFRSSSIMDQREAWRPKLFHSFGPRKGLPEEFPAPTHLRRKERSNVLPNELHQSRALFHHPPGPRG